ncbi:MAG: F0F1 ATP synthase subunit A [Candidatus Nomurabacteria bacterium]|nr:F0F1 ATP synthase subunit A [Candidatus Nomurabacteria bacterium]
METENQTQVNTEIEVGVNQPIQHEVTIYAEPIFTVGKFQITNSLITSWLAVLILVSFFIILRKKMKKVPGKMQHIFEVMMDGALSLCDQVTNDRKISTKIFPLVFSLFLFILVSNWLGLIPILGSFGFTATEGAVRTFIPLFRSGTADINTTLAFSLMVVVASNIFGIISIGIWKSFNKYVNLKALGSIFTKVRKEPTVLIVAPITFFVGILELIGEFAKVASLSFRLFGNVFAGEVLLASMAAIFAYFTPAPFLFLEVFVGLIQALIFSLLAAVYFTIAAQDHVEHEEEHGHSKEAHVPTESRGPAVQTGA